MCICSPTLHFSLTLYFEIIPNLQNRYIKKSKNSPIHQLMFHHTAMWFSFHVNILFFQRHLRVSCVHPNPVPLRDTPEEQGRSLTQPQYNHQSQELNIDHGHVQDSPAVPLLSFRAICFSVPATLDLVPHLVYIMLRLLQHEQSRRLLHDIDAPVESRQPAV